MEPLKKYVDDELNKNTVVRCKQTLQNFLKVTIGNVDYNLTKYDRKQFIVTTIIETGNAGSFLLPLWRIEIKDKKIACKLTKIFWAIKTNNPTGKSGTASWPPIRDASMYIVTSGNNYGSDDFISFDRTDDIQIGNFTCYFVRYSNPKDIRTPKGIFGTQFLLLDSQWHSK